MKKILLCSVVSLFTVSPAFAAGENPVEAPVDTVVVEAQAEVDAMAKDAVQEMAQEMASEEPAAAPVMEAHMEHKAAHWGYGPQDGAHRWADLSEAYALCGQGTEQSPINIDRFLQEDLPDIGASYVPLPLEVENSGHSVHVNFTPGSGFNVADTYYELQHIHFHTPSEHYLDGSPFPMEGHLVHKAADGTLAVIGVMMKLGAHNPVIEGIWQNVPPAGEVKAVKNVEINAQMLMPENLDYYKYQGSLTTPPCTEGVQWHVLKEPIEISQAQLKAFQSVFPVNARPVQALGERVVSGD